MNILTLGIVGIGYIHSQEAALCQGEGKAYEEQKDYVEDGEYFATEVIQLDDGTIIIIDDDIYIVEA